MKPIQTLCRTALLAAAMPILSGCGDQMPASPADTAPDRSTRILTTVWKRASGLGVGTYATSVSLSADGSVFVTGITAAADSATDLYLMKCNASGEIKWQKRFGLISPYTYEAYRYRDYGHAVAATPDGGCVATGQTAFSDIYVVKVSSSGELEWELTHPSNGIGLGIANAGDGGYIVSGMTFDNGNDAMLVKVSRSGSVKWSRSFGMEHQEKGYAVAPRGNWSSDDYGTQMVKIADDGSIVWDRRYHSSSWFGRSLAPLDDGGALLMDDVGRLIAVDRDGEERWVGFAALEQGEEPQGMARGVDGAIVVAGGTRSPYIGTDSRAFVLKVRAE